MISTTRYNYVLYVDDDFDDQFIFAEAMKDFDVSLKMFCSARAFLCWHGIDVASTILFLDVNMPKMNGFELLQALKCHPRLC